MSIMPGTRDVIEYLESLPTDDSVDDELQVEETHISVVVLKGDRAWKLKRAIHLPYADFSSPALRLSACEKEVDLNRRTAPSIYLSARRITRGRDGSLEFDGDGELVDAVVEMRRFDSSTLFSGIAARGELNRPLITKLARRIADFHRGADVHEGVNGSAAVLAVLELNEQCPDMVPIFGTAAVETLRASLRSAADQHRELLDNRARSGKVRQCHGDLHLRNICLVDGEPTLFDCIEFNDSIAVIDVLYDLAFLLMDLWETDRRNEANWLLNRYLDECDESDGLGLLPLFMALRASIRAQVLATHANMPDAQNREATLARARSYFSLAADLLQPCTASLLAIGGLSGTGKSSFAAHIAHSIGAPPGARVLSSDRIRKRLAGVAAETVLPPETYTPESAERVYDTLYVAARSTLAAGSAVIADAVFSREDERRAIESCAWQAGVPFRGVWLEANTDTLLERVGARRDEPSDATPEVVLAQLRNYSRPGNWLVVAADSPPTAAVLAAPAAGFVPSWTEAPEGWNWRAQDADGRWYWYAVEPSLGMAGGIWRSPRRAQQYAGEGTPSASWYQTCQHRPDAGTNGDTHVEDT